MTTAFNAQALFSERWAVEKTKLGELAEEAKAFAENGFNLLYNRLNKQYPIDTDEVALYKKDVLTGYLAGYCEGVIKGIQSKPLN